MRRIWTEDLADFRWHAVDGSTIGIAEDVPAGAPADTPALLELLAGAGDMEAYSSVLAPYQLGDTLLPWEHRHRAIKPASQISPDDVPECHGWPMRAALAAWICRIDGSVTRTGGAA